MKTQASLEFMLILAAVSALSLTVIALYSKGISTQSRLLQYGSNSIMPGNSTSSDAVPSARPMALAFMPPNSTMGKTSYLQLAFYNCSNGTATARLRSQSILFSPSNATIGIGDLGVMSIPFTPMMPGINAATVSYDVECADANSTGTFSLSTFTMVQTTKYNSTIYSVAIFNRSETAVYPIANASPVINITKTEHCTLYDFWGKTLPIQSQCGTSNAWQYQTYSDFCYYHYSDGILSNTTCIYPRNTQYSTSGIDPSNSTYTYRFSLSISTLYGTMHAEINNSEGNVPLTLSNSNVGYVKVENVSSEDPAPDINLISVGNMYYLANESAYAQYAQARSNLYSVLGYYNITKGYSPQIDQAIYAYNQSTKLLTKNIAGSSSCLISGKAVSCALPHPLDYNISVYVSNGFGLGGMAFSYIGSVIRIANR